MSKIKIDKETKIILLKTLQCGYFDTTDFEKFSKYYYSNLTDEELKAKIAEIDRKLGITRQSTPEEAARFLKELQNNCE